MQISLIPAYVVTDADEWIRAIEKGLDMSQEGRMARAIEQGFVYDLDPLIAEKANEQGRVGLLKKAGKSENARRSEAGREGVPERPDTFSHGTADNILGSRKAHPNRKDRGWLGQGIYFTNNAGLASDYSGAKERNSRRGVDAKQNIIPAHLRIKNPYIATIQEKGQLQKASEQEVKQFTDKIVSQGYDSAVLPFKDGLEIAVFDTSRIRSINAAFDPDFKDSSDILAQSALTDPNIDLKQVSIEQNGIKFKTGEKIRFPYIHNKDSATKIFGIPDKDSPFGRGLEPSGHYVSLSDTKPEYGNYESGEITFDNPLVIDNDSLNWKKSLSDKYKGLTGKRLSKAFFLPYCVVLTQLPLRCQHLVLWRRLCHHLRAVFLNICAQLIK
ncbi:MAG: hypothetical protein CR955_00900 [Thiotrichales bacterium]|nr:MAG: hypothetical protein CR955_00900 [Thiotrichales bacterium]